ncbi:hypothetical protein V8E51_001309 [Hyaloscypha variabilis]|jgi:hypothetical protein
MIAKVLHRDPKELSARLEVANSQSTSGMANSSSGSDHLPGTAKYMAAFGSLRENEKSCIRALKESMKELESTREDHEKQYQQARKSVLKDKVNVFNQYRVVRFKLAPEPKDHLFLLKKPRILSQT